MKKFLLLTLLLAATLFSNQLLYGAEKTLELVTFTYPPFMGESALSKDGLLVTLVKEACQSEGVNTKVTYLPTARANQQLASGESLAFIGLNNFDNSVKDHLTVYPFLNLRFIVYYLKESFPTGFKFTALSELKPYTISVLLGGITDRIGQANQLKVEGVTSLEAVFQKLYSKRNDLAVSVDLSGPTIIKALFPGKENQFEAYQDKPFVSIPGSLILNQKHPDYQIYQEKIRNGLVKIVKNGQWLKIMEQYYGKGKVPKDSLQLVDNYIKTIAQ